MGLIREMRNRNGPALLEQRVAELLEHAAKLQTLIESHEFGDARLEAEALALYCHGANVMANRLADDLA